MPVAGSTVGKNNVCHQWNDITMFVSHDMISKCLPAMTLFYNVWQPWHDITMSVSYDMISQCRSAMTCYNNVCQQWLNITMSVSHDMKLQCLSAKTWYNSLCHQWHDSRKTLYKGRKWDWFLPLFSSKQNPSPHLSVDSWNLSLCLLDFGKFNLYRLCMPRVCSYKAVSL